MSRRISVQEKIELRAYDDLTEAARDTILSENRVLEAKRNKPISETLPVSKPTSDVNRLINEFQYDCLMELGIDEHPRALEAFQVAWNEREQDGLSSVFELLKKISHVMVPVNPGSGWIEVMWSIDRMTKQCSSRRQKHVLIKALTTELLNRLLEPDDD